MKKICFIMAATLTAMPYNILAKNNASQVVIDLPNYAIDKIFPAVPAAFEKIKLVIEEATGIQDKDKTMLLKNLSRLSNKVYDLPTTAQMNDFINDMHMNQKLITIDKQRLSYVNSTSKEQFFLNANDIEPLLSIKNIVNKMREGNYSSSTKENNKIKSASSALLEKAFLLNAFLTLAKYDQFYTQEMLDYGTEKKDLDPKNILPLAYYHALAADFATEHLRNDLSADDIKKYESIINCLTMPLESCAFFTLEEELKKFQQEYDDLLTDEQHTIFKRVILPQARNLIDIITFFLPLFIHNPQEETPNLSSCLVIHKKIKNLRILSTIAGFFGGTALGCALGCSYNANEEFPLYLVGGAGLGTAVGYLIAPILRKKYERQLKQIKENIQ